MDFEEFRVLLSRINYIRDFYIAQDDYYHESIDDMILKIMKDLENAYPDYYKQFNNWR